MKTVLSIGGSDSSGGAGIQADLQAIAAQGCHGATAITAITAQSPDRVHRVFPLPTEQLRAQLQALSSMEISAIKLGMLGTAELVDIVADFLESRASIPLVVDPVLVSSSGHALLEEEGVQRLVNRILPLAWVLTPNADEAGVLLGREVRTEEDARAAVQSLGRRGPRAVVLKGGHLQTEAIIDLLWDGQEVHTFVRPRLKRSSVHGTGCVHASTLAALLALGTPLVEAVDRTQEHLSRGVARARLLGSSRVVEPFLGAAERLLG